jgi:hypothetical protein
MSLPAMPAADDDAHRAWLADGVRHQILLRALRGQRHDVLGPLSAARMGLATLKRRLAADPADLASAGTQAEGLAQLLADAVAAVALMRAWDAPVASALPLQGLLPACADLLRTDAALRGHRLTLEPPAVAEGPAPRVAAPDGHYALLGWLMHHLEAADAPSSLHLRLLPAAVQLRSEALEGGGAAGAPPVPLVPADGGPRRIDAIALDLLLHDMGWRQQRLAPQVWQLAWPDA